MKTVEVRSPTRVDLAGGTLDMWPLFAGLGGATTINVAIDVWTQATLSECEGLEIVSKDYNKVWRFKGMFEFFESTDEKLILFKETLKHYPSLQNVQLTTSSQSPVGGGLGGSSSLMISMIKALDQWTNQAPREVHACVHLAHNIEARILGAPTGTQDYYPAFLGGLCVIDYSDVGISCRSETVRDSDLGKNFLLVNTGKTHHSGLNNFDVLSRFVNKEVSVLKALRQIQEIAQEMKVVVGKKSWDHLPKLFEREYQARIQLTPKFTSPEIEKLRRLALGSGAKAMKICGAGGGGCVLILVDPELREKVEVACAEFQVLNAKIVDPL